MTRTALPHDPLGVHNAGALDYLLRDVADAPENAPPGTIQFFYRRGWLSAERAMKTEEKR